MKKLILYVLTCQYVFHSFDACYYLISRKLTFTIEWSENINVICNWRSKRITVINSQKQRNRKINQKDRGAKDIQRDRKINQKDRGAKDIQRERKINQKDRGAKDIQRDRKINQKHRGAKRHTEWQRDCETKGRVKKLQRDRDTKGQRDWEIKYLYLKY